jgi:homocysteine S-methyltransferase
LQRWLDSGDSGKSVTKEAQELPQVLAGTGPDLIAFETIPNKLEAQVHTVHYT